jgi:threonylcarbamoyladenosine tRNA methylthiotransferase MtaB
MRRHYTREEYCEVVEAALETLPQIGLGSDIITGFPGETEQDFADTVEIVERFPFSNLHVFPYSERPGTPAATLPHSVPMDARRNRAKQLIAIGERKRKEYAQSFIGKAVEVLVERVDDEGVGRGWTSEYLETRISGCTPAEVGSLISVVPHEVNLDMLYATINQK